MIFKEYIELLLKPLDLTEFKADKIICDEYLETINENIEKAKKQLKESLDSIIDTKDKAIAVANSVVLAELNRMKSLNGDKLPNKLSLIHNTHKILQQYIMKI